MGEGKEQCKCIDNDNHNTGRMTKKEWMQMILGWSVMIAMATGYIYIIMLVLRWAYRFITG